MVDRPLVLLLDDDVRSRDSMQRLFESVGCSVQTVATEELALTEIEARKDIDLVVTDINLRGIESDKSGIMFARVIRQLREDLSVAAYSGRAKELKLTLNDERTFDAYLDKSEDKADDVTRFAHECRGLALAHREVAGRLMEKIKNSRRAPLADVEKRLSALEASVIRKEDLNWWLRIIWISFGLVAGIASIIGGYLALKG